MSATPVYGFPCVENPHDFDPDGECCSPAEIEAHRLACANWGTPAYKPNKGCYTEHDASGQMVKHVLRTSWGIGVNLIDSCDGCREPAFGDSLMTCHECGGQEFCEVCWPKHEKETRRGPTDMNSEAIHPQPKPERRVTVKKRVQRTAVLTRAQCRERVYTRERMHCERCGLKLTLECYPPDPKYPHVNERVPRSQGGDPHDPKNCELLCGTCHMPNGAHAPTRARMERLQALAAKAKRLKEQAGRLRCVRRAR